MTPRENTAAVIDSRATTTSATSTPRVVATSTKPVVAETPLPDKEPVGELGMAVASLKVADQKAGNTVSVMSVVVPEGSYWVAVRETVKGTSRTLGAYLFPKGMNNGVVELLRPTISGNTYQVVLLKDNGDRTYDRATDLEVKDTKGAVIGVSIKAL